VTTETNTWDLKQYAHFRAERSQPFYDLAALVETQPGMRVVDLGCGDGRLTAWLHQYLTARDPGCGHLGDDVSRGGTAGC